LKGGILLFGEKEKNGVFIGKRAASAWAYNINQEGSKLVEGKGEGEKRACRGDLFAWKSCER